MRPFQIDLTVFNGRFSRSRSYRVDATSIAVAVKKATAEIRHISRPRERIWSVTIKATALKKISLEEPGQVSPNHKPLAEVIQEITQGGKHEAWKETTQGYR